MEFCFKSRIIQSYLKLKLQSFANLWVDLKIFKSSSQGLFKKNIFVSLIFLIDVFIFLKILYDFLNFQVRFRRHSSSYLWFRSTRS